jgi:hypothetical protein
MRCDVPQGVSEARNCAPPPLHAARRAQQHGQPMIYSRFFVFMRVNARVFESQLTASARSAVRSAGGSARGPAASGGQAPRAERCGRTVTWKGPPVLAWGGQALGAGPRWAHQLI